MFRNGIKERDALFSSDVYLYCMQYIFFSFIFYPTAKSLDYRQEEESYGREEEWRQNEGKCTSKEMWGRREGGRRQGGGVRNLAFTDGDETVANGIYKPMKRG